MSSFLYGGDLDWFRAKKGGLFYHNCLKYLLALNNSLLDGGGWQSPLKWGKKNWKRKEQNQNPTTAAEREGEASGSVWTLNSKDQLYQ